MKTNQLTHAMKTTTLPNPETQARIQQVKLGVDWHAEHFRVVRMCDGQSPQPAQRYSANPIINTDRTANCTSIKRPATIPKSVWMGLLEAELPAIIVMIQPTVPGPKSNRVRGPDAARSKPTTMTAMITVRLLIM